MTTMISAPALPISTKSCGYFWRPWFPATVVSLPLKLTQPSIYATALANDKYLFNTRMYLAISADLSEADLLKRVPQLVKALLRHAH